MATYETLKAVEAAFDEENELRYIDAALFAANTVATMREIPGLYSEREIAGYIAGACECLSVAFDDMDYRDVQEFIEHEAEYIMHGGTYLVHHEVLDAQERRKARQCS